MLFTLGFATAAPLTPPRDGAVAVGVQHSLWLKPDGTVWAWGVNSSGQLGDGTLTRRTAPVQVVGLNSIAAIAAGNNWSLALRTDGTVWSWGTGWFSGYPFLDTVKVPTKLDALTGAMSIAAGSAHGVVVKRDGTVWWWGASPLQPLTPTTLLGAADFVAVSGGSGFSVLLRKDGTVWTWGYNESGQLGDGSTTEKSQPTLVPGLSGVVAIAAGEAHTVALKSDGTVWGWGQNWLGQAGIPGPPQLSPVRVAGIPAMQRIGAGGYGTFAQTADGRVFEWGGYFSGEMGSGSNLPAPSESSALARSLALARGFGHGLALRPDGTPLAWGNNAYGQLGDGKAVTRLWPEQVALLSGVVTAAAGQMHSVAVKGDGTLWEWGRNDRGALASSVPPTSTPTIVTGISNVVGVAEGIYHSYAVRNDGSVWSWGIDSNNFNGFLGDATTPYRPSPLPITGLSNIKTVRSGAYFGVALTKTGTVWTWGGNTSGQLGDGTTTNRATPMQVPGLSGITDIATGRYSVLALQNDGTVWAWGSNGSGQLGDGTYTDRPTPAMVSGLTKVIAIANSETINLALRQDGTVWGWGNRNGTGIGTSPVPAQIPGLSGVRAIWAASESRFAQTADGQIWAWGSNRFGGLGDGTGVDSFSSFVRPANLASNTALITGSDTHELSVTATGELWAWGYVPSADWSVVRISTFAPQVVLNSGAYTVSTSEIQANSAAGAQSVALTTTTPSRPWVAARDSFWLSATPTNGASNTSLTISWQQNPYLESRTGTIHVGGQAVTVTQAGTGASFSMSGYVLVNGAGVAGVPVLLGGRQNITQLTDASGRYEFTTLTGGGAFTVTPIAPNLRISPAIWTVASLDANRTQNFTALRNATSLAVSRSTLTFASSPNGAVVTQPQELTINLSGTNPLLWNATSNKPWLAVTPGAGSSSGKVFASLVPSALPKFGTDTAIITISAPNAPNGTVTVSCSLSIVSTAGTPFGSFDTPGPVLTGLSGSIPVTGWALDDIGVRSVTIWRDPVGGEATHPNGYVYIGDATFVADTRPDVEAAYPGRPTNHMAGWGYLMLTNTLPGISGPMGNGTYRLHAIAMDLEGNQTELGAKTITVNNKNATKPFGTIDTPAPGETIEGSAFLNSGWALTPQPAIVPIDGSTLSVYVDGVRLGQPVYNQFRSDVGGIFPGYANSSGSAGSYVLDTTRLTNGMHAISWTVYDNLGRGDGVGSRYFYVLNSASSAASAVPPPDTAPLLRAARVNRPATGYPAYRTGYTVDSPLAPLPKEAIQLAELERLELHLPLALEGGTWSAGLRVGDELRATPVGATLDAEAGIFYWQLGPGFLGEYLLEFRSGPDAAPLQVRLRVGAAAPGAR